MPTLKDIRKRITSVKNTQKVTKTMKMIAAARLRKAQNQALNAREYTASLMAITRGIAARRGDASNPLFQVPEKVTTNDILVLTSDRGLCGGFNENLLRKASELVQEHIDHGRTPHVIMFGKKGRDYFRSRELPLDQSEVGFYDRISITKVRPIADHIIERFVSGETQGVTIIYNRFKSAISQDVTVENLLPMQSESSQDVGIDYIYEPSAETVLDAVVKRAFYTKIYQVFLESIASELASRMTAMDNATRNASELMEALTMLYNRARQASITKDLMDIVNGTESLSKS